MTTKIEKVLYTGKVHTTGGGREGGISTSSDGQLNIKHSTPGTAVPGTNPEQLLAAGWSACFIGALGFAAKAKKVQLPADLTVDAEVDLGTGADGYVLAGRLNVSIPGIDRDVAHGLLEQAHATCPYSKALRNSIETQVNLV